MTVTRTLTAPSNGPVNFEINIPLGWVEVTVGNVSRAEITLHTEDADDSEMAKAINQTTIGKTSTANGVRVDVPETPPITIVSNRGGVRSVHNIVAGNITGMVVTGRNSYVAGGMGCSHGHGHTSTGMEAKLTLPRGSFLKVRTIAADFEITGEIEGVDFNSQSGDLTLESCKVLRSHSSSGDVRANRVDAGIDFHSSSGDLKIRVAGGTVRANSSSGDILVGSLKNPNGGSTLLDARTSSGDVEVTVETAPSEVRITTSSGDIDVMDPNNLYGQGLSVSTQTSSGDRNTPEPRERKGRFDW